VVAVDGFDTRGGKVSIKELGEKIGGLVDTGLASRVAGIVLLANESEKDPLLSLKKGMWV
jgi:hypothetical protein